MKYSLLMVCCLLIQCATLSQSLLNPVVQPTLLDKALHLKSQKKWDQAEAEVRNYLVQTQDIYWQGAALLLLGEILEKQDKMVEAKETYNKLLSHAGYDSYHVARGLYNLSWVYEKEQNCQNVILHLTDLQKKTPVEDDFIKNVESPVRLANCYYWMGEWEMAQKMRTSALKYKNQYSLDRVTPEVWWRSHLYFGYVGVLTTAAIDRRYAQIIPVGQKELFYMIEQAPKPFSSLAEDRLIQLYEHYYAQTTNKAPVQSAVEKNELNKAMLYDLSQMVDFVEELKSYKSPEGLAQNTTDDFFSKINLIDQKIRAKVNRLELGIQKEQKRGGVK